MYLNFYGLREKPFSLSPDPKFLYLSENHRGALDHLIYGIKEKEGFIAITGDIGTGKTTICRALLERLDEKTKTALILNPLLSEDELLHAIINDFGIDIKDTTKRGLIDSLNDFLMTQMAKGGNAVLIIDEAQNLSLPVLEQIRIISNLETTKQKLIQIVLVGQKELREKLELPELRQLNQRISVRYHIKALSIIEVSKYIAHRLMVAGAKGDIIFSRSAFKEIYNYSGGIPRVINLICDRALLAGYVKQTRKIDSSLVIKGIESLGDERTFKPIEKPNKVKKVALIGASAIVLLGFVIAGSYTGWIIPGELTKKAIKTEKSSGANIPKEAGMRENPFNSKSGNKTYTFDTSFPYTIRFEAVKEIGELFKKVRMLEESGYDVFIYSIENPQSGGITYNILIGKYNRIEEARETLKKIKSEKEGSKAEIIETSVLLKKS